MNPLHSNVAFLLWEGHRTRDAHPHPAVIERSGVTTYASLQQRAAAIAAELRRAGVRPNDRVAIMLERGADAAAAFFGTVAVGAIAINVNETLRPRQIEYILTHAAASVFLTSAELMARQPRAITTDAVRLDIATIPASASLEPTTRLASDVSQIIYTSGSTGLPKGVTVSHANLRAGMEAVTTYLDITSEDRIGSLLPFSFDYGFNQLLCAVGTGATLVVERSPIPQLIVATLRQQAVTVLPAVPPLWLQLLNVAAFQASPLPLPALRVMTNTGGRLPTEAVRALRRAHPRARLFLMYGLTEAFRSTYLPPDEVDRRPDSIGRAIPGAEILVLREDLTQCAPGETGELVHRGPTVALGYWRDPEATARVYRPNPLRPPGAPDGERVVFSGDLVRQDEAGFLYHVGRRDRLIKTLGYRVSPDEIGEVLYASGEIVEALVGSEPDPERGERIVAHVVLKEGGSPDRLKAFCAAELPRHMQPSRVELHTALARLPSGKHDLAAVRPR